MREFRPLTIGGVFDAALKGFFNKDALGLLGLYCLFGLPALYVLVAGLLRSFFNLFSSILPGNLILPPGFETLGIAEPSPLFMFITFVYYLFVTFLYTLMADELYGRRFFETPYRLLPSFRAQIKRVPAFLLYLFFQSIYYVILYFIASLILGIFFAILSVMVVTLPFLLVVVLVLFVSAFFALIEAGGVFIFGTIPAMAIERQGLFKSIGRSFKLSVKNYFRILGIGLFMRLIITGGTALLFYASGTLLDIVLNELHANTDLASAVRLIWITLSFCLNIILGQLAGHACHTVVYCNQKIKHEGLGAALLARGFLEEIESRKREQEAG